MNITSYLSNIIPSYPTQWLPSTTCGAISLCAISAISALASYMGYAICKNRTVQSIREATPIREVELPKGINKNRYHPNDLKLPNPTTTNAKLQKELTRAEQHRQCQEHNPLFQAQAKLKLNGESFWLLDKIDQLVSPIQFPIEHHKECLNDRSVGIAMAQGNRSTMEDTYVATHCQSIVNGESIEYDLFGVIDGHKGDNTAKFIAEHAQNRIQEAIALYGTSAQGMRTALKHACLQLDADIIADEHINNRMPSGAVAVFCLKIGSELWIANVGDCRAILVPKGEKIIQLSEDAKPDVEHFRKSVRKRGGAFSKAFPGDPEDIVRVQGRLGTTRAFGNSDILGFSGYYVISARPKITRVLIPDTTPVFLIAASDGIWEVASSYDVAGLISSSLRQSPKLTAEEIAKIIVERTLHTDPDDNCTALVVRLA